MCQKKAAFLLKIVLYREIWLFSKILNSYYTGDCTKWIHTKRGPPVSIIALQTFFNSIPTCCKDDIVKNTEETREDQNSVKKVPITRPFYHSQKVPPHWDGAFWSKGCLFSHNFLFLQNNYEIHVLQTIQAIIISITYVKVLHDNIAISVRFYCVLCSLFIYNTKLLSCTKGFPPYQITISLILGPLLLSPKTESSQESQI